MSDGGMRIELVIVDFGIGDLLASVDLSGLEAAFRAAFGAPFESAFKSSINPQSKLRNPQSIQIPQSTLRTF
jgi:hypothetical protein